MDIKESFYRVMDKLSEGAEVTMKQLKKKFDAGTHEAMNDPKPGYHVELRNTKTGKRTTHYVKEEVELDEADNVQNLAVQAIQSKLKKAKVSYRDPNAKNAREEDKIAKMLAAKAKMQKEEADTSSKETVIKSVKPHVTTDTTTVLPSDVKPQRVKLAQFKKLFN